LKIPDRESVDSLSRLGVLVFIAATIVMSVALIRARSVTRSDDWTLRSRIEIEIEKRQKQRRLMNSVGYWFLLPMLIANGISLLGGHHTRGGSWAPDAPGLVIFASSFALDCTAKPRFSTMVKSRSRYRPIRSYDGFVLALLPVLG
jgi:hypothetical protein